MTLELIKAVGLGVVEGVTEFLPISSTGHLILVNQWISFDESFTRLFDVVIQLGAILAVVATFWSRLWPFSGDRTKNIETWRVWFKVLAAVLPALALGALLGGFVESELFNPWVVAGALMIGGIVIIIVENKIRNNGLGEGGLSAVQDLSFKKAFGIGLCQCLALVPGVSRSASTIIGAMLLGASRTLAAEFSFFLAIPTMFAASAYSLLKHGASLEAEQFWILSMGFVAAFFTAFLVIKMFLRYVQRNDFKPFGWYRIALGAIVFCYFLFSYLV